MKNKTKMNTILISLMIILVPLSSVKTQAWTTYTFDTYQSPYELNVRVGDIIVISVKRIPDSGDDLEKVLIKGGIFGEFSTKLTFQRNGGDTVSVEPDQTLPTMLNPITFTIGPFDLDDIIIWQFYLVLDDAWDHDDSSSFQVMSVDEPLVPDPNEPTAWWVYVIIGVVVLVVLLGLAYVFKKRRVRQ